MAATSKTAGNPLEKKLMKLSIDLIVNYDEFFTLIVSREVRAEVFIVACNEDVSIQH